MNTILVAALARFIAEHDLTKSTGIERMFQLAGARGLVCAHTLGHWVKATVCRFEGSWTALGEET